MKVAKFAFIVTSIILLANCTKDETPAPKPDPEEQTDSDPNLQPEEPETEVYFTLNTFANPNLTSEPEKWIVLQDSEGNLLDYRSYVLGDKLAFETVRDSLTPLINVTYLSYTIDINNRKNHEIRTSSVIKGHIENLEPYTTNETNLPDKEGEFRVNINNIPNPNFTSYPVKAEMSSGRGRIGLSGSGSADASGIDLYFETIEKYQGFDDYFISILDHNNTLKYHYFENPLFSEYTVDYQTDFAIIEKDISLILPPYKSFYLNIAGFKEGQEFDANKGYWLHDSIFADLTTNPLRVGYASIFPKYRTIFSIQMEGYNYVIAHYGKPLDALAVPPKPTFTTTSTTINMFRFITDIHYLSSRHTWNYIDNSDPNQYTRTQWSLLAEKDYQPNIGDLPNEILEVYPSLNIDLIQYKSTTFNLPLEEAEYKSVHTLTVLNE